MQRQETESDFVLFPAHSASDMLALESSRSQHFPYFVQQPPSLDVGVMDPFSYHMDALAHNQDGARSVPQAYYDTSLYMNPTTDMQKPMGYPVAPVPSTPPSMVASHYSGASGPSIASASSSAMGSPFSGAAHTFQESWIDTNHGMGLAIHEMDYHRITAALENDSSFPPEKYPNDFVGESDRFSSSPQVFSGSAPEQPHPNCLSPSFSPCHRVASPFPQAGMATASQVVPPSQTTSVLAQSVRETLPLPSSVKGSSLMPSPALPVGPRCQRTSLSPFMSPEMSKSSMASSPRVSRPPFQGHLRHSFFGQSSGNFVPPLESSCRFFP